MLRLIKCSNFHLFRILFEAALNVFKLLYLYPEIFWLSMPFSDWLLDFPHFLLLLLYASWKLLELLYIGPEHKLRRIGSSTSVEDLNRAAPSTFRTQIEQIQTHFEQPQKKFVTKWKSWILFEPQLKKFKFLLKIKEIIKKNLNIRHLMS